MFEGMLARRYISTQKRHSVLTVCSIAIAIAFMTMLFTAFSTYTGCMRAIAYDKMPFHLGIFVDTRERAEFIAQQAREYGTATVVERTDMSVPSHLTFSSVIFDYKVSESEEVKNRPYQVQILFNKYVDDYGNKLYDSWFEKSGGSFFIAEENRDLMDADMISESSRFNMVLLFSVFYVFVLFLAATVRLLIDTAFEVSSKERERQFGVLQSIGATPGQIVRTITFEGLILSVIGIPIGVLLGIGLSFAAFRAIIGGGLAEAYFTPEKAAQLLHLHISPLLMLINVVTGFVWVLLSAYGTGMRMIKKTPMQAISARSNSIKKVHKNSLFGALFGWTGKLASRNNTRQPKRFIITVVSLTLSITLFASVSVAVKEFRAAAEEMFNAFGMYDYNIFFNGGFTKMDHREPMKLLQESGIFKDISLEFGEWGFYDADDPESDDGKKQIPFDIIYCNETAYNNEIFGGKPPIPYEKLNELGGYIFTGTNFDMIPETDRITLNLKEYKEITREEYEALSPEEKKNANDIDGYYDSETDTYVSGDMFIYMEYTPQDFKITQKISFDELENPFPGALMMEFRCIITTIEVYESGEYLKHKPEKDILHSIRCNLADYNAYVDANSFLDRHKDVFTDYTDYAKETRRTRATLSAIEIGAYFLIVMFTMVAIVNMVNILSTGILNRRGELASLQCVGMTEKQLYKMTFVECLQYALGSGVAALILSEGLMFLTQRMLYVITVEEEMGHFINYLAPVPRVLIAAAAAFGVALVASLIPLRGMRSKSLVEHVHSVE